MLLRCESLEPPMSQMGHTRSFGDVGSMSGLPESGHRRARSKLLALIAGRATTAQRPSCRHQCVLCVCGVSLACLVAVSQVQRVQQVKVIGRVAETA